MIAPSFAFVGYALAAGLAIGAAGGWQASQWKENAAKLEYERLVREEEKKELNRANKIASVWAENDAALRAEHRARLARLRKELEGARYGCDLPDSGGMLLDDAIDSANAARKSGSAMPATVETGGPDDGRIARP